MIELVLGFTTTFQPFLLKRVLNYIESDTIEDQSKMEALLITSLMLVYMLLSNIINENIEFYITKYKVQSKQALISMMYSKVLRVSPSTNKKFNKGRLVNMILNDSNSTGFIFEQIPKLLVVPFNMMFILVSLYLLIDYVIIVAIVLVALFNLVNFLIAKWTAIIQRLWLKYIDKRISKINECVDNIKIIKLN